MSEKREIALLSSPLCTTRRLCIRLCDRYCVQFQLTSLTKGCQQSSGPHTRWMQHLSEGHHVCVECQSPALAAGQTHCAGDWEETDEGRWEAENNRSRFYINEGEKGVWWFHIFIKKWLCIYSGTTEKWGYCATVGRRVYCISGAHVLQTFPTCCPWARTNNWGQNIHRILEWEEYMSKNVNDNPCCLIFRYISCLLYRLWCLDKVMKPQADQYCCTRHHLYKLMLFLLAKKKEERI